MNISLHILKALKDNFIYAFVSGSECVIMDPGEAAPVERFLSENGFKLTRILLTHHHWDHVTGVPELANEWKCEVWCSAVDRVRILGANSVTPFEFELFGEPVKVIAVPGHTQGQIAYYFARLGWIFVGDTLFSAGCGRLLEGTAEQMHESLKALATLPGDTKVYFGHEYTLRNLEFVEHYEGAAPEELRGYRKLSEARLAHGQPTTPTTIAQELRINPFLTAKSLEEFSKWRELRNVW
jgi:hydroxyacylglutathione hydrolase